MKVAFFLGAALLLASPGVSQSVRAGIAAWQQGNHAAAVAIWTPLADKGDVDAAFNLGQAYRLGKGVAMDHARAQLYLEQAARTGHADAAATLGIILFQNNDRPAAMKWLRIAAEGGEPRAMLLYGTALYNGDGVARDAVTAYAFISRAAAQGLEAARASLADLDAAMPVAQRRKGVALAKTMAGPAARRPVARPAATPPAPAKPAAPIAPPSIDGKWRIQLGAFGQRAAAEALFARLQGKLGARQPFYIRAGAVTRLQVGPYPSRAAAAAACAALAGQACFPVAAR